MIYYVVIKLNFLPFLFKIPSLYKYILCIVCWIAYSSAKSAEVHAVTEELSNFQFVDENGALNGFAVQAVKMIANEAEHTLNLNMMPWARAYRRAQEEQNLMIFSIARTQQRESMFNWVGTLCDLPLYVWSLSNHPTERVNNIQDLKEYSFVVRQDSQFDQYLTDLEFKLFRINDVEQTLGMLLKGRADFTIHGDLQMKYIIEQFGIAPTTFHKVFEFKNLSSNLSLAFSKNTDSDLLEKFKLAHQSVLASGSLGRLQDKWSITCLN